MLLGNPYSGGGRLQEATPTVTRVLRAHGVAHELRQAATLSALIDEASRAADAGFGAVVAFGGDGTVNGVVNGLLRAGARIPMGILPAGTANEFVRGLPIPRSLTKAARVLADGIPVAIDAARINDRYFMNIFGIGLDARVAAGASRLRSKLSMRGRAVYYLAGLLELVRDREPIDVEIVTENDSFRGPVLLAAAVNGRMYGERCPSLPAPSLRDGLIDLYVIQNMHRMRSLNAALKLARRSPIPEIMIQRCRHVHITTSQDVEIHVDGNPMAGVREMTITAIPRGVPILMPPDAVGWRPAPVSPEVATASS